MIDDEKLESEIDKIRKRKAQSESVIASLVSEEMIRFKNDTGYSINYVNVPIIDVTTIAERRRNSTVGKVTVDVDIAL